MVQQQERVVSDGLPGDTRQTLAQTRLELLQSPRIPQSREQRGWAQNRSCLSRIKSMCRSNRIWVRFEDEDGLMVGWVIEQLKTRLKNYCLVLSVSSMAKEDRVWWSLRRSTCSQHGKINESSKNQQKPKLHTWKSFKYIQREQQKTKIHAWKIFKYALPNRKELKIHFRKTMHFRHHTSESSTTFFTPAANIPKIIPKFGMQNLSNVTPWFVRISLSRKSVHIQSSLSNPALVYPEPLPTGALSDETDFSFDSYILIRHLNSASGSDFLKRIAQTARSLIS